jgi:hypothetical protein
MDMLLAFELQDALSGNMYHVDRDRLAFRVGVIANRAAELILQKERLDLKAQTDSDMAEVRKRHEYDLAGERQKRINAKAKIKSLDFSNFREVEKQLKETDERIAICVPKLEEVVDLQCIQGTAEEAPSKKISAKPERKESPPPQRQAALTDEVYHGGKIGGKTTKKSPKDQYIQAEERRRHESDMDQGLHSPR